MPTRAAGGARNFPACVRPCAGRPVGVTGAPDLIDRAGTTSPPAPLHRNGEGNSRAVPWPFHNTRIYRRSRPLSIAMERGRGGEVPHLLMTRDTESVTMAVHRSHQWGAQSENAACGRVS